MLSYQNSLRLLEIVGDRWGTRNLEKLKELLDTCSIKHRPLMAAINASDSQTRQTRLANLLFKKPGIFDKSDDENLTKIFASIEKDLPSSMLTLPDSVMPKDTTALFTNEFYTQILALKELNLEARNTLQTLSDLRQIFDDNDSVQPLLQIVSGNRYFEQLAKSDQKLSGFMNHFFDGTFNSHLKLNDEDIAAAKAQALLDIPRETFHFEAPILDTTVIATGGNEYTLSLVTSEKTAEGTMVVNQSKPLRTWSAAEQSNAKIFVDEMLEVLNQHIPMDEALIDFWKTYLLNQQGPHSLPAIVFSALEHVMCSVELKLKPSKYDPLVCLNVIQNALRMKKLLFTFVSPHEFKMSWLDEENFHVTIKNKYLAADAMDNPSIDLTTPQRNFQDIEIVLEKFCIPLNAAEFHNAIAIENTAAYKNHPELSELSYQTCCDLFWERYAAYVVQEKCKPGNLIEKQNDLPALLMRCAANPGLQSKSESERKNIIKAIAFHWLQLLNAGQQTEIKAQMRLPTLAIVEKLSDEIKMLFAIPIVSFFSNFWSSATPTPRSSVSASPTAPSFSQSDTTSLQSMSMKSLAEESSGPSSGHSSPAETPAAGGAANPFAVTTPL